ncbi:MAG: TVP38/TMEM64 family protein [Desulfobacterales bacterium]|nr:TVP38/TMEM64 family protein [Desulfobacterales bacterium]
MAAAVIVVMASAAYYFNLQQLLREALSWISGLGALGFIFFIGLYILACVFMLPGSVLSLVSGVMFVVLKGGITVLFGATLGATCAFLTGRYLARNWVARRIAGNEKFKAVDDAVGREGWKIVLLTRLSPIFPFNLLNYAYGVTQVRLRHYILASAVGMIPGTAMYVYLGSLAGDLASLGAGGQTRTTAEWVLYGVGLLATVAVTVFVTRVARKALAARLS